MKNTTPQAYFFLSYRGKAMTQEYMYVRRWFLTQFPELGNAA